MSTENKAEGNDSIESSKGRKARSIAPAVLWSVVGLAALGTLAAFLIPKREKPLPGLTEKPTVVRTMVLAPGRVEDRVVLPGRVDAFASALLATEKGGRVFEVLVEKGDSVTNGQPLLRVDDRVWRANLDRARVERREAEFAWNRWEKMKATGAVSEQELAAVRQRVDMAAAGEREAEAHVDQCEVRSPLNGLADERFLEVGEHAAEGAAAFRVADIAKAKVLFDVSERDISAVKRGTAMEVTVSSCPGGVLTGSVSFVSAIGDSESHSYRVELLLDNPGSQLLPGMIADVMLVRRVREDALIVPLVAVVPQKQDHVVFVAEGNRAARRVVRVEWETGRDAVLASGVRAGEKVVIEGQRLLRDGALIRESEVGAGREPERP